MNGEEVLSAGLIRSGSKAKGRVAAVEMAKAFGEAFETLRHGFPDLDRVVVEGQQQYGPTKNKSRPQDLLDLALVAGTVVGCIVELVPSGVPLGVPLAREWKGQIDKLPHHRRTCTKLGWEWTEVSGKVIPDWPAQLAELRALPKGMHNHVLDAVAMGLWAEGRKGRFFFEGCAAQTLSLTVS